jgi:cyclohexadieny/prephenate dehydrogenase
MQPVTFLDNIAIIGVGLIGGSIGLAARQRKVARHVGGVGRTKDAADKAVTSGAIDEACLSAKDAVSDANLVIFCTPVDQIASGILEVAKHCQPGTVITDTGSTKASIVRAVQGKMPENVHFVGGHPLAGSEKNGVEYADAALFRDRVTVVTRTEHTDDGALETVSEFWRLLGARVRSMTPDDHDRALAMTSHLPHLLGSALAGVFPDELFELAASGFRDTTRVAAGDPSIWTPILSQNRKALMKVLAALRSRLELFQDALENDNSEKMTELLAEGKRRRDALGN